MDSRNINLDHSYARSHHRLLSYLQPEHNYAKQTSKPFLRVTSMDRKCCQSKYYKLQQRIPSEAQLASRLHIASDHAYAKSKLVSILHIASDHTCAKSQPTLLHHYLENGESKNIHLDIVKLAQTEKVIQTLRGVQPSSVCFICGKILYPSSEHWLADIPLQEQKARQIVPELSHVNIAYREKCMANDNIKTMTSSCLECSGRYKRGKKIELFDDFGEQPQCIKDLSSYTEYSKLAIAALNCNTFHPTGYSYLHLAGHVTWKEDQNILDGTIGVLKTGTLDNLETKST